VSSYVSDRIGTGKEHDLVYLVCWIPASESQRLSGRNRTNSRSNEAMGASDSEEL